MKEKEIWKDVMEQEREGGKERRRKWKRMKMKGKEIWKDVTE